MDDENKPVKVPAKAKAPAKPPVAEPEGRKVTVGEHVMYIVKN